jgi:hypothetical protein
MVKDEILRLLTEQGQYRQVSGPLRIVDTDFDKNFDAVLVGPGEQRCLVLIIDSATVSPAVISRRVRSFALVLDRSGSQRPLTVLLLTPDAKPFESLERHCRLITIAPMDDLDVALRGLLPLRIVAHQHTINAAEAALARSLGDNAKKPLVNALRKAAQKGSDEVMQEILKAISQALAPEQQKERE